ncbi:NAD-dependent epimerase/dehydratase family protein [soil metagenome]
MQVQGSSFLITGGASLIGSHMTHLLLAQGAARVVLFDNFSLGQQALADSLARLERVEVVRGDILRLPDLIDAMTDMDGVFALAAYLTLPLSSNPALGVEVNTMGVVNVLEAARIAKAGKVVFASSIATYGANIEGRIDETREFGSAGLPAAFATYAATKLLAEHLGRLYVSKHGMDVAAARFSTVYGENQHARGVNALYILEAMTAVAQGKPPVLLGDGEEAHDYVYAGDAAQGCIDIMCKSAPGEVFNIASGVSTSVNEVVAMVLEEYGSELKPVRQQDTRSTKATSHARLDLSVDKAARQLSWHPQTDLRAGIHRLRTWMDAIR